MLQYFKLGQKCKLCKHFHVEQITVQYVMQAHVWKSYHNKSYYSDKISLIKVLQMHSNLLHDLILTFV